MKDEKEVGKRIEQLELEVARHQKEHAEAEQKIVFLRNHMDQLVGQMNFKNGSISALKEMLKPDSSGRSQPEPEKKEAKKGASVTDIKGSKKNSKKKGNMKEGRHGDGPDTEQSN